MATKDDLTAAQAADAEAEGMSPEEYQAAYPTQAEQTQNQIAQNAAKVKATAAEGKAPEKTGATDKSKGGLSAHTSTASSSTTAAPSAWETLANDLASSYMGDINTMNAMASGSNAGSVDAQASQAAEADLGASASSPIGQWLSGQNATAAAQNSGVAAAEANTEKAVQSGAGMVNQGLQGMGTAETAELNAAPYTQLLTSLAQSVPYHVSESWNIPGLTSVPAGVQAAEKAVGVSTAGQGSGATQAGLGTPQTAAGGAPPVTTTTTPYNPVTGS